ncbi:MAG: class I SAM-dependent methyltransferase [Cyanobacteria bacterium K_DeepCast_35m_m2_023]|nr:class I SAM-dependent methyltransferase [Cyanobacteria bacterium K_DeepCast_35m_m2_023]
MCEPELMDDSLQAAAYAAADFDASDAAVLARIDALFGPCLGPAVIDLGCGPGNISFRLAQHDPQARVLGIDGSAAMLKLARRRLAAQPELVDRLAFAQCRLPDPALAGGYDAVVCNSLLHHLHQPQVLWTAVRQLGASGALVYVRDLRRPASPEAVLALRDRHLSSAPAVLQRDYVASLHAALTTAEVQQQLQASGLASALQVAEVDDRYLEVWGRLP